MYIKGKPWTNMKVALYKDRTKSRMHIQNGRNYTQVIRKDKGVLDSVV